jgi:flagellar protein FlgJ
MDAISLIGQDAYVAGLQKQTAAQAAALKGGGKTQDLNKVREAAEKFESFFIGQMMEHMKAGMETDPLFGGGPGEDMWKSMLNQEYGKEIAKTGRLGITEQVMQGMLRMQEQRDAAAGVAQPVVATAPAEHTMAQQDAAIAIVAGSLLPPRRS